MNGDINKKEIDSQHEMKDDELDKVVGGLAIGPACCPICGATYRLFTGMDNYLPNGERACPSCVQAYGR